MKACIYILSAIYLLLTGCSVAAQPKQTNAKNLNAYVGTWEYRSSTEYFKVVLKVGFENTDLFVGDCIVGGYLYQKNGQTVADYTYNIPLEITRYKNSSLKIQATNSHTNNPEWVNPNKLRLYFYDEKVGHRAMHGNIELVSPTQIRWLLRHPEAQFSVGPVAERELYTVPTNVVLTKLPPPKPTVTLTAYCEYVGKGCVVHLNASRPVASNVTVSLRGSGGLGRFQLTIPSGSNHFSKEFSISGDTDMEIEELSPTEDASYYYR